VFLGLSSKFCAAVAALVITPTFDCTITSNANAAAIEGSMNAAIGIFQSEFSTPIDVTIDFRYDTTTPVAHFQASSARAAFTNMGLTTGRLLAP
jgi:hypothetical protein